MSKTSQRERADVFNVTVDYCDAKYECVVRYDLTESEYEGGGIPYLVIESIARIDKEGNRHDLLWLIRFLDSKFPEDFIHKIEKAVDKVYGDEAEAAIRESIGIKCGFNQPFGDTHLTALALNHIAGAGK